HVDHSATHDHHEQHVDEQHHEHIDQHVNHSATHDDHEQQLDQQLDEQHHEHVDQHFDHSGTLDDHEQHVDEPADGDQHEHIDEHDDDRAADGSVPAERGLLEDPSRAVVSQLPYARQSNLHAGRAAHDLDRTGRRRCELSPYPPAHRGQAQHRQRL